MYCPLLQHWFSVYCSRMLPFMVGFIVYVTSVGILLPSLQTLKNLVQLWSRPMSIYKIVSFCSVQQSRYWNTYMCDGNCSYQWFITIILPHTCKHFFFLQWQYFQPLVWAAWFMQTKELGKVLLFVPQWLYNQWYHDLHWCSIVHLSGIVTLNYRIIETIDLSYGVLWIWYSKHLKLSNHMYIGWKIIHQESKKFSLAWIIYLVLFSHFSSTFCIIIESQNEEEYKREKWSCISCRSCSQI